MIERKEKLVCCIHLSSLKNVFKEMSSFKERELLTRKKEKCKLNKYK